MNHIVSVRIKLMSSTEINFPAELKFIQVIFWVSVIICSWVYSYLFNQWLSPIKVAVNLAPITRCNRSNFMFGGLPRTLCFPPSIGLTPTIKFRCCWLIHFLIISQISNFIVSVFRFNWLNKCFNTCSTYII